MANMGHLRARDRLCVGGFGVIFWGQGGLGATEAARMALDNEFFEHAATVIEMQQKRWLCSARGDIFVPLIGPTVKDFQSP